MLSLITSPLIFMASFIVILSVLVFVHELGHYAVARFFNVSVERFSIGFGKPIWRHKAKSGTEWVISNLPLGGYVKFLGDAGAASNPDHDRLEDIRNEMTARGEDPDACYHFKPVWQRALIALAGPVANFLWAIFAFSLLAFFFIKSEPKSVVIDVSPNSAAQAAGIEKGDFIQSLDGKNVSIVSDLQAYVAVRSGQTMKAVVERDGDRINIDITPKRQARRDGIGGMSEIGMLGVTLGGPDNVVRYDTNPISAVGRGYKQFSQTLGMTGTYIGRIFKGQEDGSAFGGPLRIFTMTGKVTNDVAQSEGEVGLKLKAILYNTLMLMGGLSIGLGVANLMPIPALDGGHLVYYGYEAVAGRPLSEKKQEVGFRIGFAILLTLLLILTINDISYIRSIFA